MTGTYDADPVFQANPAHLDHLLQKLHTGALAIPDFQREFTWEPRRTATLLRSMMSRFPAGTFLFWAVGHENERFGHRAVEGAPSRSTRPNELVLDGQQRLTSLYRALNNAGDERFFLHVMEFLDLPSSKNLDGKLLDSQDVDFEKAITWYPVDSAECQRFSNRQEQLENHLIPVDEHRQIDEWIDDYAHRYSNVVDEKSVKTLLRKFRDVYLTPLRSYGFPVVTLPSNTRIEAVATVFETINSTGKALGPFELLTARFYPDGVLLRDLWEQAIADYPILDVFSVDAYSILQGITLRSHNSAQRSDVLKKLTASDVKAHWEPVVRGYARVLELLQAECGVVAPKLLPYTMLLVPMSAVWEEISKTKGPEQTGILARLKQFFWCTVFTTNYDQGANSQAGADYAKLRYWLYDNAREAPEAVANFSIDVAMLRSATTRRKALYAGVLALTVTAGARDFHSSLKLTPDRVRASKVDSHHIFPKSFLRSRSGPDAERNSELILNRALIDPVTNKAIGSKAPSQYFRELRKSIDEHDLIEIMRSQLIDADDTQDPIRTDDYESFIERRLSDVLDMVRSVTKVEN